MFLDFTEFYEKKLYYISYSWWSGLFTILSISTQKKIQNSSDDPVLASQIKSMSSYIENLKSYDTNGVLAQNRAELYASTMQDAVNIMAKINELTQQAKTDTLNNGDRVNLANELDSYLIRMTNLANVQDGNGNYIYSGLNTDAPSFVMENGSYVYQGSFDTTSVNIAPNVTTVYNESGYSVFGEIPTGNGTFTIKQNPGNTGSVFTSPGNVVSNANYVPDTYTILFVTNSAGHMAYQVTGAASGQVVPAPPATTPADAPEYTSNININFNGMNINLNGAPDIGDSFVVEPSKKQNVFNTIQNLIKILKTPVYTPADKANFNQNLTQTSESLLQISGHFQSHLSTVGSRAAAIDNQIESNAQNQTQQNIILGSISNIDPYEVISQFTQEKTTLEITQQVYMKVQEALNNFIKISS